MSPGDEKEEDGSTEAQGEAENNAKQDEYLTFLYQLTEGAAGKSYGLNVARLAHIPPEILRLATIKSHQLEDTITKRRFVGFICFRGIQHFSDQDTHTGPE